MADPTCHPFDKYPARRPLALSDRTESKHGIAATGITLLHGVNILTNNLRRAKLVGYACYSNYPLSRIPTISV